jgi:hypothetical protein
MTTKERQNQIRIVSRQRQRYFYDLVNKDFLKLEVEKTNTNYKIAILISGGLRNFAITQEWMNKFLIEPLNGDVFVNGWETKDGIESDTVTVNKYLNLKSYKINNRQDITIPVPHIMTGKYPRHVSEGWGMEVADHILGQLFNIKSCHDLIEDYEKENGIEYDIIIRVRPDEFWFDKIQDFDLDYIFNNRCIGTPQNYISTISGSLVNDRFAMGSRQIMREYCDMFNYVTEYANYAGNDEATEFYTNHHITQKMNVPVHNIDITFMLEYPIDCVSEPGFDSTTIRHLTQNDSNVAIHVANIIKNKR